jgi:hypothetical protein
VPFEITSPQEERIARWRRVQVLGTPKDQPVEFDPEYDGPPQQGAGLSLSAIAAKLEEEGYGKLSRARVSQILKRDDAPRAPGDQRSKPKKVAEPEPVEATS